MNLAIASKLPEKMSELAFFYATLARKQAKVFEGATTKAANLFAVLFGNLSLLCILSAIGIALVLLDRHAPALVQPIMRGIIYRAVRAAPAFGSDTWLLLLGLAAYLGRTFGKLRGRFDRKEVDRSGAALSA